ncbi:IS5 family transposase [Paracoccus sp. DMF-8]|uniref:IS5 family transposase n=1 Tax=Paracoccus sp. DMF-8 TaxID=3019445 RepID=UPI0023E3688F|nr:IS5 family transposase [Paracoccus sp. DMF-8]MDF3607741.1 IS5 family transposase [Paracoccus sp. DMF-8]
MDELFWLTDAQMERLRPFFPKSRGRPRVDDRRVLSGIIFIQRNGLMWKHTPATYGPAKTLYNRWKRWSQMGVFATIMTELAGQAQETDTVMIDATHLKTHRTASSLGSKKGGRGRLIGRTKGGLNSKLHVLADAKGRPIRMFLSAGQTSDYIRARALLSQIPQAASLLADRGYDADWFRNALIDMGISPCIPSRKARKVSIPHDADLYRQRHRIENMFARLKDWRRIATRYDRCPILFLSACALAATVIYWL